MTENPPCGCTLAHLGYATTRELLGELRARIEGDYASGGGGLDYTTVRGRPASTADVMRQITDQFAVAPRPAAPPALCEPNAEAPYAIDRNMVVWKVVRDGGMLTRADYAGITSIGINVALREFGPLIPFDPAYVLRPAAPQDADRPASDSAIRDRLNEAERRAQATCTLAQELDAAAQP